MSEVNVFFENRVLSAITQTYVDMLLCLLNF